MRDDVSTRGSTLAGPVMGFREYFDIARERPVYVILGVQGSGTNLLSRILTRTFAFSVLRDRSIVFNAAARLGPKPTQADVAREIAGFRAFLSPSRLDRLRGRRFLNQSEPFRGIFTELTPAAIRNGSDFLRMIYAYRAYSLGMREMAIKSDDIWEHLDQIDAVLPNRRIILLTRDFRDNLVSVGGKHFGPVEPICAAQYVKRQFAVYEAEYKRAGHRGFHVRFETLVDSPRRFIEDVSRHFGLTPAVDPDAALATLKFRPNKIAKWKGLRTRDLAWCEAILRDELTAYGYEPACPASAPPGVAATAAANLRDTTKRIPQKLRGFAVRLRG